MKQLRYFTSIVELGSMTKAADRLNISQTALGSQIRQLESDLGVELLNRHSRGIAVTSAGQILQARAKQILELVSHTTQELTEIRQNLKETFTIGASPSVVHLASSQLLSTAHTTLPDVSLQLVEETSLILFDSLKRGNLDMLLAHDIPETAGMEPYPLDTRRTPVCYRGCKSSKQYIVLSTRYHGNNIAVGRASEQIDLTSSARWNSAYY